MRKVQRSPHELDVIQNQSSTSQRRQMGSTRKRPPEEKEDGKTEPEERKEKLEDIQEHFHKSQCCCKGTQ